MWTWAKPKFHVWVAQSFAVALGTAYAFMSWPETSVRPSTMPSMGVPPIFLVME